MEAPDKIYINNYNGNDTWGNQWHSKPNQSPSVVSHEYIRKDALLEWLKKEYETISWYYEKMKHVTGCIGDTSSSGKAEAYKKVIEKIESL